MKMSKQEFTCLNCGEKYWSKKSNIKWCSKLCQNEYHRLPYNCDYCGKPVMVPRFKVEQIKNGMRKNIFCSKDCHNKNQITHVEKGCLNCGKNFYAFNCVAEEQKFCSISCYDEHRKKNAYNTIDRECPICGVVFRSENKNQIYCSLKCSSFSQRKRVNCICKYCGKTIEKKVYEVEQRKNVYCSVYCKQADQKWSMEDNQILIDNYGIIPNSELVLMFSKEYSIKAMKSQAGRLGLWDSNRWWTEEEKFLLKIKYSAIPFNEVMKFFPNRSKTSVLGQARQLGLYSYEYITSVYTQYEDDFLRENYLIMANEEITRHIGHTPNGIAQRLYILNLHRPHEIHNYECLNNYIRAKLTVWKQKYREKCNYVCSVTGIRQNIEVHHIRSFNLLMQEALELSNLELLESIDDYTQDMLDRLEFNFMFLQEMYDQYCCVTKNVHRLFHSLYGFGNNTVEQWEEFKMNYSLGLYKEIG